MNNFNNVVPVTETAINGKLQQTVSAKQLHSFLSVGRDFSTWIKSRIDEYALNQNEDYLIFDSPVLVNQSTNIEQCKTKRGGDRRSIDYVLTINTAKELAMIENNEQGRAIRKYFIRCEAQLKQIAPSIQKKELKRLKARIEVANYSRPMCDALTLQRLSQGKETKPHHYTNEFNMINGIVLGVSSGNYKKANNISGNIRDQFNEATLNHLAYLEKTNITLIEIGFNYEQRKAKLIELSNRYLTQQLAQAA
ncbi:phage anti-repressor protein [Orbus hercynius]|uniref:Phage anti-repressor protein n=1 Tax=Orbus hercynius TaxID=593135 RepID=A0A495RBM1_9GAMM|nr:antA/AntB antirepressor family protein [Orbus hercynius]RKS84676.1 phage anti-repressor protein [Orbus hercynius]